MSDFAQFVDVLGQLPFLKTYSHLMLGFPLAEDEAARAKAIRDLQSAIAVLTDAFPWLAAKVVDRNLSGAATPNWHLDLEPCARWITPNSILKIQDNTDICESFENLCRCRGPASKLSGGLLAPWKAFPEGYQETEEEPAPVVAFQANLIKGGVLLNCAAQHNFMDMSGIGQCFKALAEALTNGEIDPEVIKEGNMDRRHVVPLLEANTPLDHSCFLRSTPTEPTAPLLEPGSPFSWCYFRFSAAKLANLKTLAMARGGLSVPYISTNDALSAFCWQRVICTRLQRRKSPDAMAKFCRAVDARKTLNVPKGYMGDLVTIAQSTIRFGDMATASLGAVASLLRRDLSVVNTPEYIRSFATFIDNSQDKSTISYGGKFHPDTDIGSSSWSQLGVSDLEFGALGKPRLVRRPTFAPLMSDIYFMPQTISGDVDALLCFNQRDFDGLARDEQWLKFADPIG